MREREFFSAFVKQYHVKCEYLESNIALSVNIKKDKISQELHWEIQNERRDALKQEKV